MNKAFNSALNDPSSFEFHQFAPQVEKILLSTIQSDILNAVAVQVTRFSANRKETSTIASVNVTVIDDIKIYPVIYAVQVKSAIEGGISSGKLKPLKISQIYVTGLSSKYLLHNFLQCEIFNIFNEKTQDRNWCYIQ